MIGGPKLENSEASCRCPGRPSGSLLDVAGRECHGRDSWEVKDILIPHRLRVLQMQLLHRGCNIINTL